MDLYKRRKRSYNSTVSPNEIGTPPYNMRSKMPRSCPSVTSSNEFCSNYVVANDDLSATMSSASYSCESKFRPCTVVAASPIIHGNAARSSSSSLHTITDDGPSTSEKCTARYNNTAQKRKRPESNWGAEDPDLDCEPLAKRVQQDSSLQYEKGAAASSSVAMIPSSQPERTSLTVSKKSTQHDVIMCSYESDDSSDCITDDDDDNGDDDDDAGDDGDEVELGSEWSSYSTLSTVSSESSVKLFEENARGSVGCTAPLSRGERTPGQPSPLNKQGQIRSCDKSTVQDQYSYLTPAVAECDQPRQCPLPALSWANARDVWQLMCQKDEWAASLRDPWMMDHHPSLQSRMRAILLDWLIEVCEVYKLHRETFYLAVDYLDRYLSIQRNVPKTHLQLIGITCLFVAAKVEEIYPPKLGEFAYVTDGACSEDDILKHEILILKALKWNINPITPIGWLGVYMQLKVTNRTPASFNHNKHASAPYRHKKFEKITKSPSTSQSASNKTKSLVASCPQEVDNAFIYPQFSSLEFVQTAQLLDLCSLDIGINRFPYSVLAAGALSHTFNRETAVLCSGLDWQIIQPCAEWMEPFFQVISEQSHSLLLLEQNESTSTKYGLGHVCPNIVTDDSHTTQTHTITMTMIDRVCLLQEQILTAKIKQEASPANGLLCPHGLLTPPASSRKPLDDALDVKVTDNQINRASHSV